LQRCEWIECDALSLLRCRGDCFGFRAALLLGYSLFRVRQSTRRARDEGDERLRRAERTSKGDSDSVSARKPSI
jgi:hypothetical protein